MINSHAKQFLVDNALIQLLYKDYLESCAAFCMHAEHAYQGDLWQRSVFRGYGRGEACSAGYNLLVLVGALGVPFLVIVLSPHLRAVGYPICCSDGFPNTFLSRVLCARWCTQQRGCFSVQPAATSKRTVARLFSDICSLFTKRESAEETQAVLQLGHSVQSDEVLVLVWLAFCPTASGLKRQSL